MIDHHKVLERRRLQWRGTSPSVVKVRYLDTSGPSMAMRSTRPWERRHLLSTDWGSLLRIDIIPNSKVVPTGLGAAQFEGCLKLRRKASHRRSLERRGPPRSNRCPSDGYDLNFPVRKLLLFAFRPPH